VGSLVTADVRPVGSTDGKTKVYDGSTGTELYTLRHREGTQTYSLIPLVISTPDGPVFCMQARHRSEDGVDFMVQDLETGECLHVVTLSQRVPSLTNSRVVELNGRYILAPMAPDLGHQNRPIAEELPLIDLGEVPGLVMAAANKTG
jgi:hypothetical protein